MKNLEFVSEFGVEEISPKMMEEINGGVNVVYNVGYALGYGLYYVGKGVYTAVKKAAEYVSEAVQ